MRNPLGDTISTKNQNKTLSRNQVSSDIYRFSQRICFFFYFFFLSFSLRLNKNSYLSTKDRFKASLEGMIKLLE